mmetsp:Transcript_449/g.633  ORF Transcript_449/g.633 Transcript_449/m.633 type:complete len:304 (+) Transcript_449:200-1111(+)
MVPLVTKDPRFRAAQKLIRTGRVHLGAVNIFSVLLERAKEEFGEQSLETAAVSYEYGHSLFLNATRSKAVNSDYHRGDQNDVATLKTDYDVIETGLEHMVIGCTIFYEHLNDDESNDNINTSKTSSTTSVSTEKKKDPYLEWSLEQLPRALVGIGDIQSFQQKHGDAIQSYLNALPYREAALEKLANIKPDEESEIDLRTTLEVMKSRRLLVEVYTLIVEEILQCLPGHDIKTSESNEVLIKDTDRIKMAKIYYEKAREELQEVIFLMAKIDSEETTAEKENVCHLATMVMEAGINLSTVAAD